MSTHPEQSNDDGAMLHPELVAHDARDAIYRDGRRLDHAEAASKPEQGKMLTYELKPPQADPARR